MNVNISGTDGMVGEYLICKISARNYWSFFCKILILTSLLDRGFTQTFQSLEQEKNKDRTKKFEVFKIVEVTSILRVSVVLWW